MDRRRFILFSFLLPISIDVQAFLPALLRILKYSFRVLARGSFSRYSSRMIGRSIARTRYRAYKPSRIKKIFGTRKYSITGKNGRIIGSAQIEGEVMILRGNKNHILGYLQSENKGLAVYSGNGNRLILFKQKNNRIIAYNSDGDYLGQLIEDMVKDQIKSYFIDRKGNKHNSIPVEFKQKNSSIVMTEQNTRITNEKLEILDKNNKVVLYGIYKDENIVVYDLNNNIVSTIKKNDGVLSIYDINGNKINNSNNKSGVVSIEY